MSGLHKEILKNGLTVLVEQDKSTALASVNVLYRVGSRNESPDKTGFAHLFEHLMFGGSKNVPNFDAPLQDVGGENNAFTGHDSTNFFEVLPAENLETALWVEADRMAKLKFSPKVLNTQKKVVIEEFKEVCINVPYGDVWHHLSAMAYKTHPYQWPTIGRTPEDIANTQLKDVKAFYAKYYHPSNAILSIISPLPVKSVLELVYKWFADIPAGIVPEKNYQDEPERMSPEIKTIYSDVPGPTVYYAFQMPGRLHRDYYICDILTDLMAGDESSRLYRRILKQQNLVSQIDSFITGSIDPGLIIIEAKPMPDVSIDQVDKSIWQELEDLKQNKVSPRELAKIVNKVATSIALDELSILNRAISSAHFEHLGIIDKKHKEAKIYESITAEEIQTAARKYFDESKVCQLNYLPLSFRP